MDGKRVRLDSKFQSKKRASGRYLNRNDWISPLPDDILVDILSFLPLEEATCTSVLSSRWMNLWKYTPCLDFDAQSALDKIEKQRYLLDAEKRKYVKWVDRVLRSHKANTLKEFRVCFDLSRSSSKSITRWLEFALVRHVEKLVADFSPNVMTGLPLMPRYVFPEEFLTGASMSKSPSDTSSSLDFKSLKELTFIGVNFTGEAIEILLRMCPLLEKLVFDDVNCISNLQVCGPSLALKHLGLWDCRSLKSLKISAPNLTALIAPPVENENILLENVPMLIELSLYESYYAYTVDKLHNTFSCCISQLEILTLRWESCQKDFVLSTFPELPKLKKLVIGYCTKREKSLMGLTPWIRASPNLEEFVLKLKLVKPVRLHREVKNTVQFPHHHLKVLKFCGYYGRSSDVELVTYILENSVVLEKIIIEPYKPYAFHGRLSPEQTIRDHARQQVGGQVPQHVELVIL